jgi:hypothetical protein
MPKPRTTSFIDTVSPRTATVRASLALKNGAVSQSQASRIEELETLVMEMQRELAVQFQRIAELQMQIDRVERRHQRRR